MFSIFFITCSVHYPHSGILSNFTAVFSWQLQDHHVVSVDISFWLCITPAPSIERYFLFTNAVINQLRNSLFVDYLRLWVMSSDRVLKGCKLLYNRTHNKQNLTKIYKGKSVVRNMIPHILNGDGTQKKTRRMKKCRFLTVYES